MLKTKIVSSLEKPLLSQQIEEFTAISHLSALMNERVNLQFLYTSDSDSVQADWESISCETAVPCTIRQVESVPVFFPVYAAVQDTNYVSKEPGIYPDYLDSLHYDNKICILKGQLHSAWITLETGMNSGKFPVVITIKASDGSILSTDTLELNIINDTLKKPDLLFTEWFHCDCLASYYHVKTFSEEHWRIIENFMMCASKNGINLILTPIFTPPLDTEIGKERPTTQLVKVFVVNGKYSFDFSLLEKWVALAHKCGINYFEISHLFTQWGAAHAPKIVATVDGVEKRIFGWDTDASTGAYPEFLACFLPELLSKLKELGIDKNCRFHISDEPNTDCLEAYKKAKNVVSPFLKGYPIMDAMSHLDFYEQGICEMPIPGNNAIEPFLKANVPGLWTYYCCGQHTDVSNRFIAMPSYRNRCIGYQMYKYNIRGFLQWGFNYYFDMGSHDLINPYLDQTGGYQVPAGDAFQVYPASDGTPLESIRLVVFHEALQDLAALQLCEHYYSHEEIVRKIETICGEIRFNKCPTDASTVLKVRECVNTMIEQRIQK